MSRKKQLEVDFGSRFEEIRLAKSVTARAFSEKVGIVPNSYLNYKQGRVPPGDVLARVIDVFDVSPSWLMTGEGKMFRADEEEEIIRRNLSDPVAVLGHIEAGKDGRFIAGEPLYYLPKPHGVPEKPLYGFEVRGDSMAPAYKEGDIVFATPTLAPASGKDMVVQLQWGELVLKRWHQVSTDTVKLISINPSYDPFEVDRSQILAVAQVVEQKWGTNARMARIDEQ